METEFALSRKIQVTEVVLKHPSPFLIDRGDGGHLLWVGMGEQDGSGKSQKLLPLAPSCLLACPMGGHLHRTNSILPVTHLEAFIDSSKQSPPPRLPQ